MHYRISRICIAIVGLVVSAISLAPAALPATPASPARYAFDGSISETTLRAYLSRAVTAMYLLHGEGNLQDNIRMLRSIGAKFCGRTIFLWGGEETLDSKLKSARAAEPQIHLADPDMILEACIFEIVTRHVDQVAIPGWVFQACDRPIEQRNFRFDDMQFADGKFQDQWGKETAVPDISRPETQLWFYFLAKSYIDIGAEAIHFGQIELMDQNDPKLDACAQMLARVRAYGKQHARRHIVLCTAHVPGGGLVREGHTLFDFHEFPLRIIEIPDRPQEAEMRVGYVDSIYGRSKGGITPSGWSCEHLPYLVELDNWAASEHPGQPRLGGIWVWGYDEITWFAHQPEAYRNQWLRYADKWVRDHDAEGYLEMPAGRGISTAVDGKWWYSANTPSPATPNGFGQEETIKQIWNVAGR